MLHSHVYRQNFPVKSAIFCLGSSEALRVEPNQINLLKNIAALSISFHRRGVRGEAQLFSTV